MIELTEYRELFFSEAREQVETLQQQLSRLERARDNHSALDAAFRAAHTLKGMAATMGYDPITLAAHDLEDYLQAAREHPRGISLPTIQLLERVAQELNLLLNQPQARADAPTAPARNSNGDAAPSAPAPANPRLVRVSLEEINQLQNCALELLLDTQQLAHAVGASPARPLADALRAQREKIARLRELVWQLRMTTAGQALQRYISLTQELAQEQGKHAQVVMEGEDLEIGREVIEAIAEPMLHLMRNAIAHGIETPSERIRAGKSPVGMIWLRVQSTPQRIQFQVADDGRGLDADAILQAAYEQELITDAARRNLSQADAFELILQPGFSLAPRLTALAGRGMGMNIVKTRIKELGGTLAIASQPGLGTTFTFELPRVFDATEVELVRVGAQIYGLPVERIAALRAAESTASWDGDEKEVIDLARDGGNTCALVRLDTPHRLVLRVDETLGKWLVTPDAAPLLPLLDLDILKGTRARQAP